MWKWIIKAYFKYRISPTKFWILKQHFVVLFHQHDRGFTYIKTFPFVPCSYEDWLEILQVYTKLQGPVVPKGATSTMEFWISYLPLVLNGSTLLILNKYLSICLCGRYGSHKVWVSLGNRYLAIGKPIA